MASTELRPSLRSKKLVVGKGTSARWSELKILGGFGDNPDAHWIVSLSSSAVRGSFVGNFSCNLTNLDVLSSKVTKAGHFILLDIRLDNLDNFADYTDSDTEAKAALGTYHSFK